MNSFDIYVHGTPRGHQIWGSEHNHDYIGTFYNHDTQVSEKVVLQIDVCGGVSFYTYLRHQNVYDVEGRPRAFFALTIGFRNAFCTNVYRLYQLFDAVYNQICVGSILKKTGNEESYLVADLTTARSGVNTTVNKIQAAFTQKIEQLIAPSLQTLASGDTFNKTKKTVSLLEVDSPLFFDYFKKHSLIVSPQKQPSAIALDSVSNELRQITAQKNALSSSNEQLQSEVVTLSQENKSLSSQLHASASSSEKKYKSKIEHLQSDLINITKERDSLKKKITEATSSIELMDKPFQKLTRLLAGRFPENDIPSRNDYLEEKQEVNNNTKTPVWRDWLNTVLLSLILVTCCSVLMLVLRTKYTESENVQHANTSEETTIVKEDNPSNTDELAITKEVEENDNDIQYSDWSDCTINVIGSSKGIVKKNTDYTVKVCLRNWREATVPSGTWVVDTGDNIPINLDGANSFAVPNDLRSGTNLIIKYIYNNRPVITKIVTVE